MPTKIIATTKRDFEILEQILKELPLTVSKDIESIEKQQSGSIKFTIYQKFDAVPQLNVMDMIKHIETDGDEIRIYCFAIGWFHYPYKLTKFKIIPHVENGMKS